MAGIGPISTNRKDLLKRASYSERDTKPTNDLEIFLSLCVGRVFLKKKKRMLYFVDSPSLSISEIIRTVFQGINKQPKIEQLYMDEHNLINAAMCIHLTPKQMKLLMVALRMNGIHILHDD